MYPDEARNLWIILSVAVDWVSSVSSSFGLPVVGRAESFRSNDLLDGLCCFLTNPGYVN